MEVILLERVPKLGQMGDVVRVKNGYARNFLLPSGKALRATEANRARFERERVQLEARNLEARREAEGVGEKLAGRTFIALRQASESGQLYGSVSPRDIAETLDAGGFTVERAQVHLDRPIKMIGMHEVIIALHPEVEVPIHLNVARSEEEAARQARGEDVTRADRFAEEEEEALPELEEVFEHPQEVGLAEAGTPEAEGEEPETAETGEEEAEPRRGA